MAVDVEAGLRVPAHGADAKGTSQESTGSAAGAQRANGLVKIGIIGLPQLRRGERAGELRTSAAAPAATAAGLLKRQDATCRRGRGFPRAPRRSPLSGLPVLHRHFAMDGGRLLGDVGRIDVGPGGLERAVKRQRDVQRIGDVQKDVAIDAAVGRVPVRAVPGQLGGGDAGQLGFRSEAVVRHDRQDVGGAAKPQVRGKVEPKRNEAGAVGAQRLAV